MNRKPYNYRPAGRLHRSSTQCQHSSLCPYWPGARCKFEWSEVTLSDSEIFNVMEHHAASATADSCVKLTRRRRQRMNVHRNGNYLPANLFAKPNPVLPSNQNMTLIIICCPFYLISSSSAKGLPCTTKKVSLKHICKFFCRYCVNKQTPNATRNFLQQNGRMNYSVCRFFLFYFYDNFTAFISFCHSINL